MIHSGTQPFETPRLICRRFEPGDWGDMLANWAGDPNVQSEYGEPAYSDEAAVMSLLDEYIRGYLRPDFYRWAIIEKTSGCNIGQIAFCRVYSEIATAEIEYCIGGAFQGNGYASEALEGLVRHIFSATEFEKLEAYHRLENVSSGRVLEKSPMHVADTVERFGGDPSAALGKACYCITRKDME